MTNVTSCDTAIPADRARAIKARQQAMWASGDFAVIGATLQIVGELLNEAADVRARPQGAGCRRRQRQRHARGGAALRQRDVHRLRAGAPRARTPPGGG